MITINCTFGPEQGRVRTVSVKEALNDIATELDNGSYASLISLDQITVRDKAVSLTDFVSYTGPVGEMQRLVNYVNLRRRADLHNADSTDPTQTITVSEENDTMRWLTPAEALDSLKLDVMVGVKVFWTSPTRVSVSFPELGDYWVTYEGPAEDMRELVTLGRQLQQHTINVINTLDSSVVMQLSPEAALENLKEELERGSRPTLQSANQLEISNSERSLVYRGSIAGMKKLVDEAVRYFA